MLNARANSALGAVRPRLRIRKRMVATGAPMNTAAKAAILKGASKNSHSDCAVRVSLVAA
jgi:hypothetical protein